MSTERGEQGILISKRQFLQFAGATAAAAALGTSDANAEASAPLKSIVDDAEPISVANVNSASVKRSS